MGRGALGIVRYIAGWYSVRYSGGGGTCLVPSLAGGGHLSGSKSGGGGGQGTITYRGTSSASRKVFGNKFGNIFFFGANNFFFDPRGRPQ